MASSTKGTSKINPEFITSREPDLGIFMPKTQIATDPETSAFLVKGVFNPESSKHIVWNFASLFCIIYQAVSIPYRIGFETPVEGAYGYIEFSMTLFFLFDIRKI